MKGSVTTALLAVLAVLAVPSLALADQCAWVSAQQARDAAKAAVSGRKYIDYCEPCGDQIGRVRAKVIETVSVKEASDGTSRELFVNGDAKDLAYVFVQTSEGASGFENLAALAGCRTEGVSAKVELDAKPATKQRPKRVIEKKPGG